MEATILSAGDITSPEPYTALMLGQVLVEAPPGAARLVSPAAPRHVFVTHQHGDHLLGLPQLLIRALSRRETMNVYAPLPALAALRRVVEAVYPDMADVVSTGAVLHAVEPGRRVSLGGLEVEVLPARHSVPAVMYVFRRGGLSLLYTGDTGPSAALEEAAARVDAVAIEATHPCGVETDFHLNACQVDALASRLPGKPFVAVHTPLGPRSFHAANVLVPRRLPATLRLYRSGGRVAYEFG